MFGRGSKKAADPDADNAPPDIPPLESNLPTWKKMMPVIACGAGLFSDGYINNVGLFL